MADMQQLEDQIVSLSLLEASALVKKLEERLGVSAAAAVAAPAAGGGGAAAAAPVEEKTEFTVILKDAGREQDLDHQDRPRSHRPRLEGSQGSGRRRSQAASRRTSPRMTRRPSSRSSKASQPSRPSKLAQLHKKAESGILSSWGYCFLPMCADGHPTKLLGQHSGPSCSSRSENQAKGPAMLSVKRRMDSVKQAGGSETLGHGESQRAASISSNTVDLVRKSVFALPGAFVPGASPAFKPT